MSAAIELFSGYDPIGGYAWARAVVPCALNGGREKHTVRRIPGADPDAALVQLMGELRAEYGRVTIERRT